MTCDFMLRAHSPRFTCTYLFLPIICFLFSSCCIAESYKIGAILPLSGESASLGIYLKQGMELAKEQLPREQQKNIEIIYEDDRLTATRTVAAAQKLISVDKVKALLVLGSGSGNAAGPIAERAGVILIAIGASDAKLAKDKQFVFTHWITPAKEAKRLYQEIQRKGYKRVGLITAQQEGALAVMRALVDEIEADKNSAIVVINEQPLPDVTNFKDYIAKAKARDVQAVVVCLFPGSIASFAKQIRSLGVAADLVGIELFEDQNEVKASDGALLNQWYVNADDSEEEFASSYQKKYGIAPGWGAANAYDSLRLLSLAAFQEGTDNKRIARYLNTLKDYQGAVGTYSATGDNRFDLPVAIKIVTENGFKKLS